MKFKGKIYNWTTKELKNYIELHFGFISCGQANVKWLKALFDSQCSAEVAMSP